MISIFTYKMIALGVKPRTFFCGKTLAYIINILVGSIQIHGNSKINFGLGQHWKWEDPCNDYLTSPTPKTVSNAIANGSSPGGVLFLCVFSGSPSVLSFHVQFDQHAYVPHPLLIIGMHPQRREMG